MGRTNIAVAALAGMLLTAACSGEPEATDTTNVTRNLLAQPASDGISTPLAGPAPAQQESGPLVEVSLVGINRGELEAPVKVVEMSDYGCGYCRQFHEESFPSILDEFIETGMVEWKFVPYITGMFGNSLPATEAAECTYAQDPEAFEVLNRQLWDEQRAWKGSDDPAGVIRPWVESVGIDMATFDTCLQTDEQLEKIASATTLARQLGVRGTPTFVVLGYAPLQGALPLETFRELLTAVHSDRTRRPAEPGQP